MVAAAPLCPMAPTVSGKAASSSGVEAKNRAALKAAGEAALEANGYFTDPDWREVVSPDGVRCFITSFVAPARRARALPHPLMADLSIPNFLAGPNTMDSRQPHGRQLKRTPGRQPILAKKESKDG